MNYGEIDSEDNYSLKFVSPTYLIMIGRKLIKTSRNLLLWCTVLLCKLFDIYGAVVDECLTCDSSGILVNHTTRSTKLDKVNAVHPILNFFDAHLVTLLFRTSMHLMDCCVHFLFYRGHV